MVSPKLQIKYNFLILLLPYSQRSISDNLGKFINPKDPDLVSIEWWLLKRVDRYNRHCACSALLRRYYEPCKVDPCRAYTSGRRLRRAEKGTRDDLQSQETYFKGLWFSLLQCRVWSRLLCYQETWGIGVSAKTEHGTTVMQNSMKIYIIKGFFRNRNGQKYTKLEQAHIP